MKTKLFLIFLLTNYSFFLAIGNNNEFKFGKIDNAELTSNVCPIDSSADAYIICRNASSYFTFQNYKMNFSIIYECYVRIKILKKSALDWATVNIPLYYAGPENEESVEKLKGNTYNYENGHVVVSKLDKHNIYKEQETKTKFHLRFSMPNVKEGSVIEYSYTINCQYVRNFTFQYSIPVLNTEYKVSVPEYYKYKIFQNGYEGVRVVYSSENSTISIPGYEPLMYTNNIAAYSAENLKAFHDEPYMKSDKNYISSVEMELQSIQIPYSLVKNFSTDWKHIETFLLDDEDFGDLIKHNRPAKDIINQSITTTTDSLEKARAIYSTIQNQFKWNGMDQLWASKTLRKTIDEKEGSSADINLLLVSALRYANLNAYPVVLSTRDNGMILTSYPMLDKLNYVIACLQIGENKYLLDATDKYAPFGFLPDRCLNGQGRLIDENKPQDIDLTSNQNYNKIIAGDFTINENGDIDGTWEEILQGYAAHNLREEVGNTKSKDDFIKEKQKQTPGLTIVNYQMNNLDSLNNKLTLKYQLSLTGQTESEGNLLIFHPLLTEQMKENIFKSDVRNFPVDYSYQYNKTFVSQFEIPKGYTVETLPKPIMISLPGHDATFTYNIMLNDNKIQVLRKLVINKIMFLPEQYPNLKEFYNQMVAKENEVVVLKKI